MACKLVTQCVPFFAALLFFRTNFIIGNKNLKLSSFFLLNWTKFNFLGLPQQKIPSKLHQASNVANKAKLSIAKIVVTTTCTLLVLLAVGELKLFDNRSLGSLINCSMRAIEKSMQRIVHPMSSFLKYLF